MTSALHQITMSHSTEEDRLLLRISTLDKAEFRFWLTRRFVNILWPALMKVLEKENPAARKNLMPEAKKAVVAMEHQDAVAAADFSRSHDEGNKDLTPGTGDNRGPLLVIGGSVSPDKSGATGLILKTNNNAEIKVSLNKALLHALCKLLIEVTMKAGWDLGLSVGNDAAVVLPQDKTRMH